MTWSIRFPQPLFSQLQAHLFPGDQDEHGAVIAAGISITARGTRLLAREVFLAQDGIDYIPGERGYRMLTPKFVAECAEYCAQHNLVYLAIHNHFSHNRVGFSKDDLASHQRGYPALLDIVGQPVGALVFAQNAIAGDIWLPDGGRVGIDEGVTVGSNLRYLYPEPLPGIEVADPLYDRHARLFGDVGQWRLKQLTAVVIGAGGGGSLLVQMLSHLGVGHISVVDFDRVETTNLPRIVGANHEDVGALKVQVAQRLAQKAQPGMQFEALEADIRDLDTACLVRDADVLFLATDNLQSRLVFNALIHQYLIPGFQIGAKVRADRDTAEVDEIFAVSRPVLPFSGGGCLHCAGLIPPHRLQEEALSEDERRRQRYVDAENVPEPSVITLNAIGAAHAVNDMLLMVTGLFDLSGPLYHLHYDARERALRLAEPAPRPECLDCGTGERSRLARGDAVRLPCREKDTPLVSRSFMSI